MTNLMTGKIFMLSMSQDIITIYYKGEKVYQSQFYHLKFEEFRHYYLEFIFYFVFNKQVLY